MREVALVEHPPRTRCRQGDKLGDGARAAFLREADEREQHLGRRLRVRQSAVARLHRRPKEVGELPEARAGHAPREQPSCERDRVDDRRCEARSRQALRLAIQEGEVEARVVCDEHRVAREDEEVAHRGGRRGRAPKQPVGQSGHRRDHGRERHVRIDERLEFVDDLEADDLDCADLADLGRAGPQSGRLEVDDDVGRVLEQEIGAERTREPDRVAVPRESRVGLDHLGKEAMRPSDGRLARAKSRGTPRRRTTSPCRFSTSLHESVGGV